MIDLKFPVSLINYDHNAVPAFFVNKEVWGESYWSIIREALLYRNCYIVVDYEARISLGLPYATFTLTNLDDFDNVVKPMITTLLNGGKNINENWKRYYDRWATRMLFVPDREALIEHVINKYGNWKFVRECNIFDALYEYAVRFGEELEDDDELEKIVSEYIVDGYKFTMSFEDEAKIIIQKV